MILYESISGIVLRYASGEVSPREVISELMKRLHRLEPTINAFLTLNEKLAEEAANAEKLYYEGRKNLLLGVPVTVKDLILTRGIETTGGSRANKPLFASDRDAPVVGRLRRAGAILIGKTNLHEFAFGITSENEHFGPVRNPWNPNRVAGGSSGGSAASLASGLGFGSIGTDTRGSIRIPSACCGTSGLKPTYGTLSTKGVYPLSPTLDHVGPMARSVSDLKRLMAVLTADLGFLDTKLKGFRLAVCPYYLENIDEDVVRAFESALEQLEKRAECILEWKTGILSEATEASDAISRVEAVFQHDEDLRRQPENYGPKVRERLEGGYLVSGLDYLKSLEVRKGTTAAFRDLFRQADCLVTPALPIPAPVMNTSKIAWPSGTEESLVQCMVRLNAPQNVAGIPALTIPCGFSARGMPVGLQLIGWKHRESLLLDIGDFFQAKTDWHLRRPPLDKPTIPRVPSC